MSGLGRDGWPSADTVLATERKRTEAFAAEVESLRKDAERLRKVRLIVEDNDQREDCGARLSLRHVLNDATMGKP